MTRATLGAIARHRGVSTARRGMHRALRPSGTGRDLRTSETRHPLRAFRTPRSFVALLAFAVALAIDAGAGAGAARAQSVSVSGSTSLRYIELRPLASDSVPAGTTEGTALLRALPDGRVVRCVPGDDFCRDLRPAARVSTIPMVTDLEASAWGFGEGLRLFTQLRLRNGWGSAPDLWPRGSRTLEALAAFAELDRGNVRVRLGRQWTVSGLGFYNFDGLSAQLRPARRLTLEAYGGRSLVRGLNESRASGALESIEALAPPSAGILGGFRARYTPAPGTSFSAAYQVESRGRGEGLLSELAVLNAMAPLGAFATDASLEMDMAGRQVNEAMLRVRSPAVHHATLYGELRRYRPYFELWTIWGAFSPLAYDEARAGVTWVPGRGALVLRGEGSRRRYERDDAGGFADYRREGWGLGASGTWTPVSAWRLDASGRLETGFGAARREGSAGIARQFAGGGFVALQAVAFQQYFELRLDDGTVLGGEAEGALPLNERLRVRGTLAVYRHAGARAAAVDWNQRRASLRLEWNVGNEPRVRAPMGVTP